MKAGAPPAVVPASVTGFWGGSSPGFESAGGGAAGALSADVGAAASLFAPPRAQKTFVAGQGRPAACPRVLRATSRRLINHMLVH